MLTVNTGPEHTSRQGKEAEQAEVSAPRSDEGSSSDGSLQTAHSELAEGSPSAEAQSNLPGQTLVRAGNSGAHSSTGQAAIP